MRGERVQVNGTVQGVGFRPTVWRLARECGLRGSVCNHPSGVIIELFGEPGLIDRFVQRLYQEQPPLARIERLTRTPLEQTDLPDPGFRILPSREGMTDTAVTADAATCPECLREIFDPQNRRYRYPFTNCTHCGPRLSIINGVPYDRAKTSMAAFTMCPECQAEYDDPGDRRFHAQPNACPVCGPSVWLEAGDATRLPLESGVDATERAARLIRDGKIVAIKGIGGFHLACDASNAEAVSRLRERKQRYQKALALMARDLEMVARFSRLSEKEAQWLSEPSAPIVVLNCRGESLAEGVAPGQNRLGFMLPYTPLHHLLMCNMAYPIVLTSGNRSEEPQTIDNSDAAERLNTIADYYLMHDREIINRVDDSVISFMDGQPRLLRRARGFAPRTIPLPDQLTGQGAVLAMGGELKNTFCLAHKREAVLSQYMGDLEDARTYQDYQRNLELYRRLYDFTPELIAIDRHPDYLSSQLGQTLALEQDLPLIEVQHHHAHIAACMVEHAIPADGTQVLGIALDGLGWGEDQSIWGGEFLCVDYRSSRRLACFKPVAMPGGAQAMYQPWRNTYAQLCASLGWERVAREFASLDIVGYLRQQPLDILNTMQQRDLNSPLASSAGRLFDAVAAALGICRERAAYEGQAAIELEALALQYSDPAAVEGYGFTYENGELTWSTLWYELLEDLARGRDRRLIAARFHQGLASAVSHVGAALCNRQGLDTLALSGGVFQNRLLLESTSRRLREEGLKVISPIHTPANDGGIALGQAAIALSTRETG